MLVAPITERWLIPFPFFLFTTVCGFGAYRVMSYFTLAIAGQKLILLLKVCTVCIQIFSITFTFPIFSSNLTAKYSKDILICKWYTYISDIHIFVCFIQVYRLLQIIVWAGNLMAKKLWHIQRDVCNSYSRYCGNVPVFNEFIQTHTISAVYVHIKLYVALQEHNFCKTNFMQFNSLRYKILWSLSINIRLLMYDFM
jgi:hypothetical protein